MGLCLYAILLVSDIKEKNDLQILKQIHIKKMGGVGLSLT